MSLINAKNFFAPFTNVVHMITILLVAICFAVLRLNGASLSIHSNSSSTAEVQQLQPEIKYDLDPESAPIYKLPSRQQQDPLNDLEKTLGIR